MANNPDLLIQQGADWWKYVLLASRGPRPLDLRGCVVKLIAAAELGASPKLFELSSADGGLLLDRDARSVFWNVPAATTAEFVPTSLRLFPIDGLFAHPMGFYMLQVIDSASRVVPLRSGRLLLKLAV